MSSAESKITFFRQSSWMMLATIASGACMFLVQPVSKFIPEDEYANFHTMLQILAWLMIPGTGLQLVFARYAAGINSERKKAQLTGAIRAILKATFGIWLLALIAVFLLKGRLMSQWELTNSWPLWITLMMGLLSLWIPVFMGTIQGRQDFFWMGWTIVLNGLGRLIFAWLVVLAIAKTALSLLTGALIGLVVSFFIAFWKSKPWWTGRAEPLDWMNWIKTLVPLTLGLGSALFMLNADIIFLQIWYSSSELGGYAAIGTLARALVMFTAPLAAVMFPKIVHSLAHNVPSNALLLTVTGTLILGGLAAIGLGLLAPAVIQLGFNKSFAGIAPLLPWFAFAMLPLAMANVLINNLMARSVFRASPCLAAIAVGYAITVANLDHPSFKTVIQLLGLFNLLLLGVAGLFSWLDTRRAGAPSLS